MATKGTDEVTEVVDDRTEEDLQDQYEGDDYVVECSGCGGSGMGAQTDVDSWDPCRSCRGSGKEESDPDDWDVSDLPLRIRQRMGYYE